MHALRLLPLLPLLLLQEPAAAPASLIEPAQRYRLKVGEETIELEEGRPVTPHAGGPSYLLELLPTRILRIPGAFSFEYPREFAWSGAMDGASGWCSVNGRITTIHLQRHHEDPAAVVERYVQSAVASGALNVRDATITLGRRTVSGRAFDQHVGGFQGWEADIVQEVYGFEQGGSGWLLMLQRTHETTGELQSYVTELTQVRPAWPFVEPGNETDQAVQLLQSSFRFEE